MRYVSTIWFKTRNAANDLWTLGTSSFSASRHPFCHGANRPAPFDRRKQKNTPKACQSMEIHVYPRNSQESSPCASNVYGATHISVALMHHEECRKGMINARRRQLNLHAGCWRPSHIIDNVMRGWWRELGVLTSWKTLDKLHQGTTLKTDLKDF